MGIADIAFGNGSSKGLIKGLFERRLPHSDEPMAYDLASYAGWNTASNSLGYTLGQGLMARHMLSQERKDLLNVRYLDDWAYEASCGSACVLNTPIPINGRKESLPQRKRASSIRPFKRK